jgi:hypothetical protein
MGVRTFQGNILSPFAIHKKVIVFSSEWLVAVCKTIWRGNPEDDMNFYRLETFESYKRMLDVHTIVGICISFLVLAFAGIETNVY